MLDDGNALDVLHDKVGQTRLGCSCVEHGGDIRVVQHGQRLALGLKAGNHLPAIHPGFDDLQGHAALYGLILLSQIDNGETALAQDTKQPVRTDLADRLLP